jgi:hypothetical protein
MSLFWKREDPLERRLRRERPAPRAEFVEALGERLESEPYRRRRPARLGFAAAVSIAMLVSLSAFGGLGYAASSVSHVVQTAVHVVTPPPASNAPAAAPAAAKSDEDDHTSSHGQYGHHHDICVDNGHGHQHTISISDAAVASFLATHPNARLGACDH